MYLHRLYKYKDNKKQPPFTGKGMPGNTVGADPVEVGGVGLGGGLFKLWLSEEVALELNVRGERSHRERQTHDIWDSCVQRTHLLG